MRKEDRLAGIVEMLRTDGFVKSAELSRLFGTSEMTIWRDIDELEKAGVVKRVHGGAIDIKAAGLTENAINQRILENSAAKEQIAEYAVSLLKRDERVFIDSGSTGFTIARKLSTHKLRTICATNTLNTASELCKNPEIKIIMIGGELKMNSMCSLGVVAEAQVKSFRFSVSFVACNGIDENGQVMLLDIGERSFKRTVIESSERCYLICDSTKIGQTSMIEIADVKDFTGIITDKGIDAGIRKRLEDLGAVFCIAG